jgi:hypothetical protein
MQIITPIKVKLETDAVLTYEQLSELVKQSETLFLELKSVDLNKDSDIKLSLFKQGFKWVPENNSETVYLEDEKLIKFNTWSKWIRLNPNTLSMDLDYRNLISGCLECFSEQFKVWLTDKPLTIKEVLKLI